MGEVEEIFVVVDFSVDHRCSRSLAAGSRVFDRVGSLGGGSLLAIVADELDEGFVRELKGDSSKVANSSVEHTPEKQFPPNVDVDGFAHGQVGGGDERPRMVEDPEGHEPAEGDVEEDVPEWGDEKDDQVPGVGLQEVLHGCEFFTVFS